MKLKIAIVCSAVIALAPYAAKADLDPMSLIQDKLRNGFEEANKVFKEYTGQELDLQQLVNNRDRLSELKKMGKNFAIDAAMSYASNVKIRSLSVGGITGDIKGSIGTPELARKLGKKMTQKSMINDDVLQAQKKQKMINELQVENVATMYAKALVLRRSIINEGQKLEEEEKTEITDLPQIEDAYKAVSTRANGRWKSILDAAANYQGQTAASSLLSMRADAAKEAEEEAEAEAKKKAEEEEKAAQEAADKSEKEGGLSLSDAYNKGSNVINDVKNGNYGSALGEVGGAAGNLGVDSKVSDGLKNAGDAYNKGSSAVDNVKNGNYGSALGDLGGAAGSAGIGGNVGDTLQNAGNTYNQGSNLVDNVSSGNIWGAVDSVVSTADSINKLGGYDQEAIDAQKKAQEEANEKASQSAAESMKNFSDQHKDDFTNSLINSSLNQQGQNILNGSSNSGGKSSSSGRSNTSWKLGGGTK